MEKKACCREKKGLFCTLPHGHSGKVHVAEGDGIYLIWERNIIHYVSEDVKWLFNRKERKLK